MTVCSKCKEGFLTCKCPEFHPNTKFELDEKECKEILEYFTKRAGYISHEFDSGVHKIIRRMAQWLEKEVK